MNMFEFDRFVEAHTLVAQTLVHPSEVSDAQYVERMVKDRHRMLIADKIVGMTHEQWKGGGFYVTYRSEILVVTPNELAQFIQREAFDLSARMRPLTP